MLCLVLKVILKKVILKTPYGQLENKFDWYKQLPFMKLICSSKLAWQFIKEYNQQNKNNLSNEQSLEEQSNEMTLNFKIQELQYYFRIWSVFGVFRNTYVFHNQCTSSVEKLDIPVISSALLKLLISQGVKPFFKHT